MWSCDGSVEIREDRRRPPLGGLGEGLEIVARREEPPSHPEPTDLVAEAERSSTQLDALGDSTFAAALAASDDPVALRIADDATIAGELRAAAALEAALASCDVIGGTAPRRVKAALAAAKARLQVE